VPEGIVMHTTQLKRTTERENHIPNDHNWFIKQECGEMFFNNISTFISHFPHENLDEIIYYTEVKELLGY
jgi:hypothetical protein